MKKVVFFHTVYCTFNGTKHQTLSLVRMEVVSLAYNSQNGDVFNQCLFNENGATCTNSENIQENR